jgi:glycosyltransferase involved in cell wall biosynthesis
MHLGHEVFGFGFARDGGNHPMPGGMMTSDEPRTPWGLRRLVDGMLQLRPRPDMVIVWSPLIVGNEYVLRRLHRQGIVTVVTLQGHLDPFLYRKGNRLAKALYRHLALVPALKRWTSVSHAQSPYEERLARELGVTGPISVFPLGIPSTSVPSLGPRPGPLRRELGMGPTEILAGYFGRFDPVQKRFDALLPALVRARHLAEQGAIRFVMAGKGSEAQLASLRAQLTRYGLGDVVAVAGPFMGDDRFRAIADLDLLLHPSRYDGLPRVIREAAAVGTPAVVTLQSNAELLVEAGGAILTGPTPAEIAHATIQALTEPGWLEAASKAARSWGAANDSLASARNFDLACEAATASMARRGG